MPRTSQDPFPTRVKDYVLGIDGCRDGWVVIALPSKGEITVIEAKFYPNFATIIQDHLHGNQQRALAIMVDMPIGLLSSGRRPCERLARKILGPRSSSVFPSPRRPMLTMASYTQANQWGKDQGRDAGGGLSKQAWNISPKIREIDDIITADDQIIIAEAHPELAFTRLNDGVPCRFSKKTGKGILERTVILERHSVINLYNVFTSFLSNHKAKLGTDDIFDAMAIALTARARLSGNALHCFDGMLDEKGLKLEIWG